MPDEYDDDDLDVDPGSESSVIRELRHKGKRVDEAEAEASVLRTENVILKAGLTGLSDARRKALLAAHEGELTSESILETAVELGFTVAASEGEPSQDSPLDKEAHRRIQDATSAAIPSGAEVETMDDLIAKAQTPDEIKAILAKAGMLRMSDE